MTRGAPARLAAILGFVALMYAPTVVAPFCSYDDFYEVHRAAFTDAPNPSLVFTTSHFEGARYRPLNRAMTLALYLWGDGEATLFRVRNLLSHLACVALAWALSFGLFRSSAAASWGALLFGVHPLANMTIVGAINTNAVGHAFLLAALLLALRALRTPAGGFGLAAASLASAAVALLTYDAEVVYFPLMALLVLAEVRATGRSPRRGLLAAWIGGGAALAGGFWLLRVLFVPVGKVAGSVTSPATLLKSLVTYGGALLLPVDPVLLHEVFGTPFPSELAAGGAAGRGLALALLGTSSAAAFALALMAFRRIPKEERAPAAPGVTFVACGVFVLLAPLLLFTKHASETYVYLPAAFVALLAGVLLDLAGRRAPRAAAAGGFALVVLWSAATLARNVAVLRCGRAAARLVAGLANGSPEAPAVLVANTPGEERYQRYGLYGFRGTDTVGDGALADSSLTSALQLARRRPAGTVSLRSPDELRREACEKPEARRPCFWVRADGSVSACLCDQTKESP